MKLITEVSLPDYPFRIDHHSPVLLMGSCFTESIGRLLERSMFHTCINPFGVIYNPLSVMRGLDALLNREIYREGDLREHNGLWFSFDHYTGFSSPDREECLEGINRVFLNAKQWLRQSGVLIVSWGTSWVYRYRETGEVVCNCHKIPADRFVRSRLSPAEITEVYESFLPHLFGISPEMKILLTVSPVRHWKDGAHGNQLSKASLLLAAGSLTERFPDRVFYFPSYEIVLDELRDYRFYEGDMLHIRHEAITYIWEKFLHSLVSEESQHIIKAIDPLLRLVEHRPRRQTGKEFRELLEKKEKLLSVLKKKYPFLSWKNLDNYK
jgi:hypothetical protein